MSEHIIITSIVHSQLEALEVSPLLMVLPHLPYTPLALTTDRHAKTKAHANNAVIRMLS